MKTPFLKGSLVLALSLVLAACGGGGGADGHDHDEIDSAGRLFIAAEASPALRIYDLDSSSVAATLALANPPSALHASPGRRYALAFQRAQDTVQVVDGGIWQEDHGDHLHDYKQAPKLLASRIDGPQPTHYDDRAGRASIYMDGRAADVPPKAASAVLFTDADLGAGTVAASVDFALPMHGFAEPNGDFLVASYREAADPGPTQVEIYRRDAARFRFVRRLGTPCPGMHGSYTQDNVTVVGCADGVMVVPRQGADAFTATRIVTPTGVGTIAGHPGASRLIGIGNAGTPSTTHFYVIDARAGTASPLQIPGWTEGRVRRAHGFDRAGRHFFVLDDAGTLHVLEGTATGWRSRKAIAGAIARMPAAAPFPALATNGARDEIYLSDPQGRQIVAVNTATLEVARRIDMAFTPTYLAWTGVAR